MSANQNPTNSTTIAKRHRPAAVVIADAVELICSDGNCSPQKVAEDVIMALGVAGYEIVPAWDPLNV
jgi:tellurite resistance protein